MNYIVLDVPSPVAEHISALRRHYGSWRVILPVEIGVIGSSGVGPLHFPQDEADDVFRALNNVARQFEPIVTRFASVARFPGTGIFYYTQQSTKPFVQLQKAIVGLGLKFESSPFPFTPHCTLTDFKKPPKPLVQEIMSLPVRKQKLSSIP